MTEMLLFGLTCNAVARCVTLGPAQPLRLMWFALLQEVARIENAKSRMADNRRRRRCIACLVQRPLPSLSTDTISHDSGYRHISPGLTTVPALQSSLDCYLRATAGSRGHCHAGSSQPRCKPAPIPVPRGCAPALPKLLASPTLLSLGRIGPESLSRGRRCPGGTSRDVAEPGRQDRATSEGAPRVGGCEWSK